MCTHAAAEPPIPGARYTPEGRNGLQHQEQERTQQHGQDDALDERGGGIGALLRTTGSRCPSLAPARPGLPHRPFLHSCRALPLTCSLARRGLGLRLSPGLRLSLGLRLSPGLSLRLRSGPRLRLCLRLCPSRAGRRSRHRDGRRRRRRGWRKSRWRGRRRRRGLLRRRWRRWLRRGRRGRRIGLRNRQGWRRRPLREGCRARKGHCPEGECRRHQDGAEQAPTSPHERRQHAISLGGSGCTDPPAL